METNLEGDGPWSLPAKGLRDDRDEASQRKKPGMEKSAWVAASCLPMTYSKKEKAATIQ